MAQRLSDVESEEKRLIERELSSKSQSMGMDSWESHGNDVQTGLKHLLGMCASCKSLEYCRSEFGNVHATCEIFEFKLSGKNRITECNRFSPKNSLSLNDMFAIAYLIDSDTDKRVKGFVDTNKKK